MKYVVVFILIIAAYIAGYLTPKNDLKALESNGFGDANVHTVQAEQELVPSPTKLSPKVTEVERNSPGVAKSVEPSGDKKPGDVSSSVEERPIDALHDSEISDGNEIEYKPFTDEEIDSLAPEPFRSFLKKMQKSDLARYRKFVDVQGPTDQDMDIYNRLFDSITGNPYSKFIEIDSIQCKGGMCELRLYETKSGVWNYIQSDMRLQGWWPFAYTSAYGLGSGDNTREALYVLLRKD